MSDYSAIISAEHFREMEYDVDATRETSECGYCGGLGYWEQKCEHWTNIGCLEDGCQLRHACNCGKVKEPCEHCKGTGRI